MKALAITAVERTAFLDIPEPVPKPDEVLLQVRLVGYCGSDLNTYRGRNPLVSYPRIPGHEIAATVAATGAEVPDEWKVGTPVTLLPYTSCGACTACRAGRFNCCRYNQTLGVQRDGAATEYLAVPWRKLFTSPSLSLRELALVEPLTVGVHATERAQAGPEDRVLVLGCGAIGLGAVAGAAFRGAQVVAVDIDEGKLALARRAGASAVINSRTSDLHERVQEWTNGEGPEVVIEAIGLPVTFRAAVDEVAFAGRVVYIGYAKEPVEYETKLFVQKELDIRGSRNATPGNFRTVIRLLEAGTFPVDEFVTRVYPFAAGGQALADWNANPLAVTKLMIEMPA
ncbi:MAG: zinc-binding alcohol dehydrogenase family protein [Lentisphaeria bacterium]|jgi:threonine dehydrogenase-like Zn-dependent dehydrogenase|nr:zinc-binding alcohol dehydrogenase family protein [Lentisphaeria bacterium]